MKNLVSTFVAALGMVVISAPALAGTSAQLPEPVTLSLLVGGVAAIAAVRRIHRR